MVELQPDIVSSLEDEQEGTSLPELQEHFDLNSDVIPIDNSQDDELNERFNGEEKVLHNHLECVKQEAYLITVEGELITKLEYAMLNEESYDMAGYLQTAEQIANEKL